MIIDSHTHIAEKEFFPKDMFKRMKEVFGKDPTDASLGRLLEEMDNADIQKAVLLGVNAKTSMQYKVPNEYILKAVNEYPDRFIGFCGVDPYDHDCINEIDMFYGQGMKGVKIIPVFHFLYPNDQKYTPIYEKAQKLNLPVLFHAGADFAVRTRIKYSNPVFLDDVAVDFPDLKIIIAHFGWPWVNETIAIALKNENVYIDISAMGKDTLFNLPWGLLERHLSNKILFGSDFPIVSCKKAVENVQKLPISGESIKKIFHKNAKQIIL